MRGQELETLVRTHQAELLRYLRYLGAADRPLVEDLVQETFVAAFRAAKVPDLGQERLAAAWLRGIARNLFLMHCRRERVNPVVADNQALEQAESVWQTQFLRGGDGFDYLEALRGCLEKLPAKARQALDLRYTQNRSRAEMAQALGIGEDGVKSLLQRLRAALGDCVNQALALEQTSRG